MKKSEVYAAWGIEYKAGKIRAPWGEMIAPLIKVGTNSKVGAVGTLSTLHGNEVHTVDTLPATCADVLRAAGLTEIRGTCTCHCSGCYCDAGFYNMPAVKRSLIINTVIAWYYPDFMRRACCAQIDADNIPGLRVSASGDMCTREHAEAVRDISEHLKARGADRWTYTKNDAAADIVRGALPVTPSITPYGINYGPAAYIRDLYNKLTAAGYNVHVCACGTSYERHCDACRVGCKCIGHGVDYVLFIEHSTDYVFGKFDPADAADVLAIIAKQEN